MWHTCVWLHTNPSSYTHNEDDTRPRSKKRNFRQLFRNCTTAQKPVCMLMELILNLKKARVFLTCLRFLKKKSVLKLLDRSVCTRLAQPVLSYGREARTITRTLPSDERLAKFRNRILWRIFGPFHENDLGWGLRNNEELYVLLYWPK